MQRVLLWLASFRSDYTAAQRVWAYANFTAILTIRTRRKICTHIAKIPHKSASDIDKISARSPKRIATQARG
jgi:hypothetical protein